MRNPAAGTNDGEPGPMDAGASAGRTAATDFAATRDLVAAALAAGRRGTGDFARFFATELGTAAATAVDDLRLEAARPLIIRYGTNLNKSRRCARFRAPGMRREREWRRLVTACGWCGAVVPPRTPAAAH